MKQKRRTKSFLALALLLASVLGLAWASQIAGESVAGPEPGTRPTPAQCGGIVLLLDDTNFPFRPEFFDFDIGAFLQTQTLADYRGPMFTFEEDVAEMVELVAHYFGVNPKVLLTVIEIQAELLSRPPRDEMENWVLGYRPRPEEEQGDGLCPGDGKSLFSQLILLTQRLNEGYFAWRDAQEGKRQTYPVLAFADGSQCIAPEGSNAATFAVLYALAEVNSLARWQVLTARDAPQGFYHTYIQLFREDPLKPADIRIQAGPYPGTIKFPWHGTWYYTWGLHESNNSALDFAPGGGSGCLYDKCFGNWVVAADSGTVVDTSHLWVKIDHSNGWITGYFHIPGQDKIASGARPCRGTRIGHPGCCGSDGCTYCWPCGSTCPGCCATGTHVHFKLYKDGSPETWVGKTIDGWTVQSSGCLTKGDQTKCPSDTPSISSDNPEDCGSTCPAPSLVEPADGVTLNNRTITFRWNAVTGCTFNGYTLRVKDTSSMDSGGTTYLDTGVGATDYTCTFDGSGPCGNVPENTDLYWSVKAANAPNGASWASSRRFRIELPHPPSTPSLSSPSNGASLRSCENITLDWSTSSGASEYYAEHWGTSSGNSGWIGGTDWNIGIKSPGTYSWRAKARNQWGESGWSDTWSFTVNPNQAPNTPSPQSPDDGAWVNSRTVTLQWQDNGDPDNCPRDYRTYNVEISRSGWSNSVSDHSGTSWQVTVPSDDDYQWRVQAYDGDLTSGWSGYRTVKVDATPPDTTITNGPSGVIPTGSATFTWTGSDNRTSTGDLVYSYRLVGLSNDWSSWSTNTSVAYNGLTDGDYTFEVKARDLAGNEDPSPASRSFGVDVTPPGTTITAGPSGCTGTANVTFTWTGSDNRTPTAGLLYSSKLEGFDDWSAWTGATSKSYTGLPDGDYAFKVKARDGVGHEDPSPANRSLRVDTTPPTGSVLVNGGDSATNKIAVHLDITGHDGPVGCGVTEMRLSNDGRNWAAWQPFATEGEWLLPTLNRTTWTVHLQLKDLVGNVSGAFTDGIYLDLYPPRPSSNNYQLGARVVASGDLPSNSGNYRLLSTTVGQPLANARLRGADYRLESGYQGAWPSVPRGRPPAEAYAIAPSVIASSGGHQASESYWLWGTGGQPADHNRPRSENYQLFSGYWGIQLLPCKLLGDLDGDHDVDTTDIMQVASRWRCRRGDGCYHERYDLDKDGDIDVVDIMLVSARWGERCP